MSESSAEWFLGESFKALFGGAIGGTIFGAAGVWAHANMAATGYLCTKSGVTTVVQPDILGGFPKLLLGGSPNLLFCEKLVNFPVLGDVSQSQAGVRLGVPIAILTALVAMIILVANHKSEPART